MRKKEKKSNKKIIVFIILLILIVMAVGGYFGYEFFIKGNANVIEVAEDVLKVEMEPEKTVQVFKGEERPFAVMIDNHSDAWPQAGLQKAYMVYEIIAEGGETRLMALFKGADVEKIGPVRSARHYFLDYAMENDAIYAHFGQSPQAESDLKKYSISDINGIAEDGTTFKRVKDKYAPHNAVTSTEKLLQSAQNKKYRTSSDNKSVLHYVTDEIEFSEDDGAVEADTVIIPHSQLQTVKYVYDEQNKVYSRYARGKAQTDWDSKEPVTTKNIIITKCDNYTLNDVENKGRQGLKNIGTFDGYYITNGKAIKIKCIKNAREEKTIYQDLNGKEIDVNDGNTFVNICPINANIKLEAKTVTESN